MEKNKIELRGVEFHNKGAHLMMAAIFDQFKQRNIEVSYVMERKGNSPIRKHRELGIYTKFKFRKFEGIVKILSSLIPSYFFNLFGFVKESQVNIVLDGSGFAFGDKWGVKKSENRLGSHVKEWKTQGKKIILLPQAFGPFTDNDLKKSIGKIIKYADLIFARDPISQKHLTNICNNNNIKIAPDFTILINGEIPEYYKYDLHEVAIIPNHKMFDTNSKLSKDQYYKFIIHCVEVILGKGMKPYFLIHEGELDYSIANQVNSRLQNSIPILYDSDPVKVKGIIKASKAVITSRFHGLVSALSQGVPTLTTSWSHKYEMLLKDYNYEEALCDTSDLNEVTVKINRITNRKNSEQISNSLKIYSEQQKIKVLKMWDMVFKQIDL